MQAADVSMEEQAAMEAGAIAQTAPQPSKPFTLKTIDGLIKEFNGTMGKLSDGMLPDVSWDPGDQADGKKWANPLPAEIFVPLVALNEYMGMLDDRSFAEKYSYDPGSLVNDTELRKTQGTIKKMGKDKKLAKAFQEPLAGAGAAAPEMEPPPPPGEFGDDDEMLAQGLA